MTSAASGPRTSPSTMWSGRCRRVCRTRSRMLTPPLLPSRRPSARPSRRNALGCVSRISMVSSITTMRSERGRRPTQALRSVVLPDPVPPAIRTFPSRRSVSRTTCRTSRGSEPISTRSAADSRHLLKRRMVMASSVDAGGAAIATRDPSPSRTSTIGSRRRSKPDPRVIIAAAASRSRWPRRPSATGTRSRRPLRSMNRLPGPLTMISETESSSTNRRRSGRCSPTSARLACVSTIRSAPAPSRATRECGPSAS